MHVLVRARVLGAYIGISVLICSSTDMLMPVVCMFSDVVERETYWAEPLGRDILCQGWSEGRQRQGENQQ